MFTDRPHPSLEFAGKKKIHGTGKEELARRLNIPAEQINTADTTTKHKVVNNPTARPERPAGGKGKHQKDSDGNQT